jgi:hypothetical protein
MNLSAPTYLLDANVFIEAHRRYYAFSICPGFWDCLHHHNSESAIFSIDRVKDEIKKNKDELATWITHTIPGSMFYATDETPVIQHFSSLMTWVTDSSQFKPAAKSEFATIADGWLVAFAKAHGNTVVTLEVLDMRARRKVPIPNLCVEFNVQYVNTFEMLRQLSARFNWKSN